MSKINKCDRCGEIYDTKAFFIRLKKRFTTKLERFDFIYTSIRNWFGCATSTATKEYDLCPSCQEKLERFLEGGDQ